MMAESKFSLSEEAAVDEQKFNLTQGSIQALGLKCTLCDCYLTIPPVTITSMSGDEWKCGRCALIHTDINIPALLFEAVAASMTFPCVHANCPAEIPWQSVKRHEELCPYQPMKCPCGETVEMYLSLLHFRQNHPDIISYNRSVVENPGFCRLLTRLILKNDIPFMVYILCEREADIKVGVYNLQEATEAYEFQLKITTNSSKCSITLPYQKISKFSVRENCSDCLLKTCKLKYHKYYDSNQEPLNNAVYEIMNIRVNAVSVLNILDSDEFILNITIVEREALVDEEATLSKNERIRKSWECQICQEYLVGPIFLCPTGHSMCEGCKIKLTNCPYCVLIIADSRNFTLEEMAETAEIICQYESKGCNFSGNIECVAKHEPKCPWKKETDLPSSRKKIKLSN